MKTVSSCRSLKVKVNTELRHKLVGICSDTVEICSDVVDVLSDSVPVEIESTLDRHRCSSYPPQHSVLSLSLHSTLTSYHFPYAMCLAGAVAGQYELGLVSETRFILRIPEAEFDFEFFWFFSSPASALTGGGGRCSVSNTT